MSWFVSQKLVHGILDFSCSAANREKENKTKISMDGASYTKKLIIKQMSLNLQRIYQISINLYFSECNQ